MCAICESGTTCAIIIQSVLTHGSTTSRVHEPSGPSVRLTGGSCPRKDDEREAHAGRHPADAVDDARKVHRRVARSTLKMDDTIVKQTKKLTAAVLTIITKRDIDSHRRSVLVERVPRAYRRRVPSNKGLDDWQLACTAAPAHIERTRGFNDRVDTIAAYDCFQLVAR